MAKFLSFDQKQKNDGPLGNVQEPAQKLEDEPPPHFTRDLRPKPLKHSLPIDWGNLSKAFGDLDEEWKTRKENLYSVREPYI
jgi:hypothetical protein